MNVFIDLIKGIVIGIGAVSPGISGGTLAVILGVYERITNNIATIFSNMIKKIIDMIPLGIGICIGILGFSNIVSYLFKSYGFQVRFLFIGLMLGTLPMVIKEANRNGFKKIYLLPCLLSLFITVLFIILEDNVINVIPEDNYNLVNLIIYGIIIGFGTIVPGVSSSFILMYLGVYELILDGISHMDLTIIIPVGIGFVLGVLVFASIIRVLFKIAYGYTYYIILGFIVGSIITIIPAISSVYEALLGTIIAIIGLTFTMIFSNEKYLKKFKIIK